MKNPSLSAIEQLMAQGAADALARAGFSRRTFIKGTGALIVSFSMGGALGTLEAQTRAGAFGLDAAPDSPPANEVDSWIAIASDGSVTAYTGKEELGQGMSTAQIQIVAEELCVPFHRVNLIVADTSLTPDQGVTSGSQSHPANFNHGNLAGACATARGAPATRIKTFEYSRGSTHCGRRNHPLEKRRVEESGLCRPRGREEI